MQFMRLAAGAIGAGVPLGDVVGRIEAAHPRACLVRLASTPPVTLVTPDIGHHPRGITVAAPRGFSFEHHVKVGDELAVRGGVLRTLGGTLSIDLRGAPQWRSDLKSLKLDLSGGAVRAAWRCAWATLNGAGASMSLLQLAATDIGELVHATRRLQLVAADRAMSRLVGLGEGLTPAGDDYLVGYFAGLWSCAGPGASPRTRFSAELGRRLRHLALTANRVSRIYLEAASEGEVAERLAALTLRIARGAGQDAVNIAATRAIAVGHSSGRHNVFGLLLAARAWGLESPGGMGQHRGWAGSAALPGNVPHHPFDALLTK
jgi:hypothetical protein